MSTFTKSPVVGDIVGFSNNTKKEVYWRRKDFDAAPSGYTVTSVVVARHGNTILKAHKFNANKKWADIYDYVVTGYHLDGESHVQQIRLHAKPTTSTWYEFVYTATTIEEFAEAFNSFLQETDAETKMYVCYVDEQDRVILRRENYAGTEYYGAAMTYMGTGGLSLAAIVGTEVPINSQTDHYNGANGADGAILNMNRGLLYFKQDISSASYNPTSVLSSIKTNYPVCKPAYLGTSAQAGRTGNECKVLRDYYGDGEAGWLKYMERQRIYKGNRGNQDYRFDAKKLTYALADVMYETKMGDPILKPKYPAANYCAEVGYEGVKGQEKGDWFLGNIRDITTLMEDQTYPAVYRNGVQVNVAIADADPVNNALNKIGGNVIGNNVYVWSSVRYNAYNSCYYNGNSGFVNGYYFYSSYRAVPLSLSEIEP